MKLAVFSLFFFFVLLSSECFPQSAKFISKINGIVLDSETNEPLSFASVYWNDKSNNGTLTDDDGNFILKTKDTTNSIIVSCVGYKKNIMYINVGKSQDITIKLVPEIKALNEIIVKPQKVRYRNKDNPAVKLIQQVIDDKPKNRKEGLDFYSFEKYEKLQFSLSDFTEKFQKSNILKNFQFLFENIDTTTIPGKKMLPFFLKETLSDVFYRKSKDKNEKIIEAEKMVRFDEYINSRSIGSALRFLDQDINIYDNNITLLTNQFLSPIANVGPTFYKYFILDTVIIEASKCIRLVFFPRNKENYLFLGHIYIMADSSYAVKKIEMTVDRNINLNWIKDLSIVQEFDKINDHNWMLSTDEITVDFGLAQNKIGVFGQRSVSYKNYLFDSTKADSIYESINKSVNKDPDNMSEEYWNNHRHEPLSLHEKRIYTTMDSIKHIRGFRRAMDASVLLTSGFVGSRNYVEFGPTNTFYSYNPIEGSRVRFGGRTTQRFSKKINFDTYAAYGVNDNKYKYFFGASYSFTSQSIFDFPVKSLKISYQNDIKILGQDLQFAQDNNVLFSFKRGINDKMYYNKTLKIEQLNEFPNHFSYLLGYEYTRQIPTGNLFFDPSKYSLSSSNKPYLNLSQVNLNLRYAPNERFFQGKIYRVPIVNQYPVFQFQYLVGSKIIGNQYNYNKIILNISKRFYLSLVGFTDLTIEAGKIFGKVSFPLLDIHPANQTYSYQSLSYNLMNFLEFVSDKYAALYAEHSFNGFVLNNFPVIKKFKFREYLTCKILYGGLSKSNDPALNSGLFKFPADINGNPITYTFGNKPYIEAGIGISNILKLFRLDLIKRFTYLDHQDISTIGLRVSTKIDF